MKLIKTDGTIEELQGQISWDQMRKLMECDYIEPININSSVLVMFGDEEARMVNEPKVNELATEIYRKAWGITDPWAAWERHVAAIERMGGICMGLESGQEPFNVVGDVVFGESSEVDDD